MKPELCRYLAGVVLVCYFALLIYNGSTLTFWDDEVQGNYYYAKVPFSTLFEMMRGNHSEDAPLFMILAHPWGGAGRQFRAATAIASDWVLGSG